MTWIKCNDNGEQRAGGEIHLNIKSMFCKNNVFKEKQTKAVLYFLIQASASQYWITSELLWCFCMQHMIYYCTFCCTITASEDSMLLKKLSKLKLLLFPFFLLINCFKSDETDSLFICRLFSTCSCWQYDILSSRYTHLFSQNTHAPQERSCLHSPRQFVLCQEICAIFHTCVSVVKIKKKFPQKARCCLLIGCCLLYWSQSVDTSYAG